MEFGQLEALVAVAREHSFGRAAAQLSRTQPAISIAIGKLEKEVGAALFDRFRKDARLTAAGEILFEYAQKILNLKNEAGQAVDELRQLHRGKVSIGANESTSLYLLPGIILEFRKRHPDIKVEVFPSSSVQLPSEIKERNLDFGIIAFDRSATRQNTKGISGKFAFEKLAAWVPMARTRLKLPAFISSAIGP